MLPCQHRAGHSVHPESWDAAFRSLKASWGGLDGFVSNAPIRVSSGHNYRGDLVHREAMVVLEYQGDHHREPEEFRKDMTRRSRLEADGWHIMLIGPDDLRNPRELCTRIRTLLALARARMPSAHS